MDFTLVRRPHLIVPNTISGKSQYTPTLGRGNFRFETIFVDNSVIFIKLSLKRFENCPSCPAFYCTFTSI